MAIIFKDSSSFEVLCNIEAFCVKKGLLLRNKAGSFFFLFYVLQKSDGLSCRNIYGKIFYITFCIEYATKLYQEGNIDVYMEYY